MMSDEAIVRARGLTKRFRNGEEYLTILDGLELEIRKGETVTIMGESGSGKTTLLSVLSGLDGFEEGEVWVAGHRLPIDREAELTVYRRSSIGLIFQFHHLLDDFSARENVMIPAMMAGLPRQKADGKAEELLKSVGLEERLDHHPPQLSGGERQRVALARALVNDPRVVFADEPTGSLDADNTRLVRDTLFRVAEERGTTLVLVTHSLSLADEGDRHLLLERGRIRER